MRKTWWIAIIALIMLAACAAPAEAPAPTEEAEEEGDVIVLGDISDDPGEVIEGTQPLADYLAENLADYGITRGEVRVATSAEEMIGWLESGEVDIYFDSVYPATLISDESGAEPFLRRWRRGVAEYYTVIFTTADSGIDSVEDLNGRMVAMDNPFSTSGYVLPAVYLAEENLELQGYSTYDEQVSDDHVGFVFSYDDENTLQWVLSGLVDAGATDNVNYAGLPDDVREDLVILAESEPLPRQVAVARPGIDPDLLAAIQEVLVGADETEAGQAALEAFDTTARFDEFPEGLDATLSRMREMRDIVLEIPVAEE